MDHPHTLSHLPITLIKNSDTFLIKRATNDILFPVEYSGSCRRKRHHAYAEQPHRVLNGVTAAGMGPELSDIFQRENEKKIIT